jgi:hypothetical protein
MDRHGLKHSTLKWNRFEYHSNIVKKISRKEQIILKKICSTHSSPHRHATAATAAAAAATRSSPQITSLTIAISSLHH